MLREQAVCDRCGHTSYTFGGWVIATFAEMSKKMQGAGTHHFCISCSEELERWIEDV